MDTQLLASVMPTHFLGHTMSHRYPYPAVGTHTCSQYQLTYRHSPPSPITHTDRCWWPWPKNCKEMGMQPLRDNCLQGWPHLDTARQPVLQSHSHTHFRSGHECKVTQHQCPHYPAIYHSHNMVTPDPIPSCTMSQHHRETQFLSMQIRTNHTDISGHTPSQPMWTDAYFTHRDISTQFPFHTSQAHSQAYAQKCSDPDVALTAAYTQKTQFLMEPCTQPGDSHPVAKSHSNTSSPAYTQTHIPATL